MRLVTPLGTLAATVLVTTFATAQHPALHVINGGLPAVSPDGRRIAFTARRDTLLPRGVYVIGADGSGERRLGETNGSGGPVWMPAGAGVLFAAPSGMQVADPSSGVTRSQQMPTGRQITPSPDGRWLLYSAGSFPRVLLTVSAADGSAPQVLSDSTGAAFNGAWSADGRQVAYAFLDSTRAMQVWVVGRDGTGRRQVTHFTAEDGAPQWPSWSPDGKTLAVQAGRYNGQDPSSSTAHIWLVDVATGAARKLAPHDRLWLDETPSFFPDGRRIAFQSDRTGRSEVWVMDVDGTHARQVTR